MQQPRDDEREEPCQSRKRLRVEWAQSEWFRIYLQLARQGRDNDNGRGGK